MLNKRKYSFANVEKMKSLYHATIVIPTYNSSELLNYTLNSIVKQSLDTALIEVIVVDDGSSDATIDTVKYFNNLLNLKYFFQEDKGNRVSRARNIGIENASAEVIIFIDSGILLDSDCVQEHIKQHELNGPECAVIGYVYGFDQYDSKLEQIKRFVNCHEPSLSIKYLREQEIYKDMRDRYYTKYNFQINRLPAPWAFFLTCNVSVNKSYLHKTGIFDEIFDQRWGVEDLDLGYRLYKNHISFVISRKAEALHFPHDSDMSEKFREEVHNKVLFHQKHGSLATELFLTSSYIELNDNLIQHKSPITCTMEVPKTA